MCRCLTCLGLWVASIGLFCGWGCLPLAWLQFDLLFVLRLLLVFFCLLLVFVFVYVWFAYLLTCFRLFNWFCISVVFVG